MRGTDPIKSSWVYPNSENLGKIIIFFTLNLYLIYKFYINLRLRGLNRADLRRISI